MEKTHKDLKRQIDLLENQGKLIRVKRTINKDTEIHPLVRWQFRGLREKDRKAFLFENVIDCRGKRYDMPVVVGAMAGSQEIYNLGLGCGADELDRRWQHALQNPIPSQHLLCRD